MFVLLGRSHRKWLPHPTSPSRESGHSGLALSGRTQASLRDRSGPPLRFPGLWLPEQGTHPRSITDSLFYFSLLLSPAVDALGGRGPCTRLSWDPVLQLGRHWGQPPP